jgi:hypothetical protein
MTDLHILKGDVPSVAEGRVFTRRFALHDVMQAYDTFEHA